MDINALDGLLKLAEKAEQSGKFATVMGMAFPFVGLKKKAVEVYVKDIENSDLPPESKMMAIYNTKKTFKELKNQAAIIEIAKNAAKDGTDFSNSSLVDEDWLARYLDSAKFVSDEETQVLWGNVLAGEFESPGSAPSSIIRILSEMTRADAEAFSALCSMRSLLLAFDKNVKLVFGKYATIIPPNDLFTDELRQELPYRSISNLEFLGLIKYNPEYGFKTQFDRTTVSYVLIKYENSGFLCSNWPSPYFPIGTVEMSQAGEYLSKFVYRKTFKDYVPVLKTYLVSNRLSPVEVDPDNITVSFK